MKGLLADLGWRPEAVLDLGGVETAKGPEVLFLLTPTPTLIRLGGFRPFAISAAYGRA